MDYLNNRSNTPRNRLVEPTFDQYRRISQGWTTFHRPALQHFPSVRRAWR